MEPEHYVFVSDQNRIPGEYLGQLVIKRRLRVALGEREILPEVARLGVEQAAVKVAKVARQNVDESKKPLTTARFHDSTGEQRID